MGGWNYIKKKKNHRICLIWVICSDECPGVGFFPYIKNERMRTTGQKQCGPIEGREALFRREKSFFFRRWK